MKTILVFFKTIKTRHILFLFLLVVIFSFSGFVPIYYIQKMIDAVNKDVYRDALVTIIVSGMLYILFQLISQFVRATYSVCKDKYQNEYARSIRNKIFNHLLTVDELQLRQTEFSKLSNTLIEDTQFISDNYFESVGLVIVAIVQFVIGFIFMSSINLSLSLLIIPLGLITSFCSKKIEKKTENNLSRQKEITEDSWQLYSEGIKGIKHIRLFDCFGNYFKKIKAISRDLYIINIKQSKLENFGSSIIGTLYMATIALIMLFSAVFVLKGKLTFGGLLALVMYNHMLIDPLLDLIDAKQKIIKLGISFSRVEQIFKMKTIQKKKSDFQIDSIIFENVSFSYNSVNVLKNWNMVFEKDKTYCIVGKTGAGKSTVADLITGYLTCESGTIKYHCGNQTLINVIPERISYLQQDCFLFNASIEDNIKFANPDISGQFLNQIIKDCCLNDLGTRMNDKIAYNGFLLSGGEKKRLQLAICLAKTDSDVLIFDELSGSLDADTYELIINNIQKYFKDRIVIFIEHHYVKKELYDHVIRL